MSAGAPTGEFVHVAALYASDEQLRDLLLPYFAEGLRGHENILAVISDGARQVMHDALGDAADRVQWGGCGVSYDRLGQTFEGFAGYLAQQRRAGIPTRVVGEFDSDSSPDRVSQYLRYESMASEVYAPYGYPVVCLWDQRRYPTDVLAHVRAVHPQLLDASGPITNAEYRMPIDYLARVRTHQQLRRLMSIWSCNSAPSMILGRYVGGLRSWSAISGLGVQDTDDIVIAVDEIATNALEHGRPPARVRGWTTPAALFVRVDDHGRTSIPATTGYHRPGTDARRGRGIWIARHLADVLTTHTDPTGTTVAMRFTRSAGLRVS
ncbi:MAG: MEDS domain-containing protein [Pseudonocardiaceae bacterium]